jgi:uncharacterized integral membrane protein
MRLMLRLVWIALFVGVLVVGWKFAAANGSETAISYVFGELAPVPLWLALLVAFAAGLATAGLLGLYQVAKLRLLTRRFRKTVRGLEAEVHQLRTLPLSGEAPVIAAESERLEAAPRGGRGRGG